LFGAKSRRQLKCVQTDPAPSAERISVILPVLNEEQRIAACLDGVIAQSEEVQEILVVDRGFTDATRGIVARYKERDTRVSWLDASPIDVNWTG